MNKFTDNRKHVRLQSRFPLKYKDLRQEGEVPRGTITKNISEGGVRFRSDRFISLACRLVLELNLPALDNPIRAVSKVTWIKKLPAGEDYEVGNKFLEISREDRETIRDFVDKEFEKSSF